MKNKKRVAFTLSFNCKHHLKKLIREPLINMFDYWVFIEGASGNGGSTRCCHKMPDVYHSNGHSVDGTLEYLCKKKVRYHNIIVIPGRDWGSKDDMVNAGLQALREKVSFNEDIFLWEFDADEVWDQQSIEDAELELGSKDTGMFLCDYFVGKNLLAKGEWGEGKKLPYRRLWRWDGRPFKSHEPPILEGGNGAEVLLPQRFKHYAYYYEKDVKFKNDWYKGHEGIYQRWLNMQTRSDFPIKLSELISGGWGNTDTKIVRRKGLTKH